VIVLLAEKEDQPIAGMLLYQFRDRVSAEYLGWDRMFADVRPSTYIYWEVIKLARSEGYKIFDFGRTSKLNESLMDFKRHWGTYVVDLPQFYYPKSAGNRLRERENSLPYMFINIICRKAPDSSLKTIGKFCYRHLG